MWVAVVLPDLPPLFQASVLLLHVPGLPLLAEQLLSSTTRTLSLRVPLVPLRSAYLRQLPWPVVPLLASVVLALLLGAAVLPTIARLP